MTDEEIEKALTQCGDLSDFDCKGCPLEGEDLCYSIIRENALDYINRLKIRVQELGACGVRILEREADYIRKDTAKEILGTIKGCQTMSIPQRKQYNRYELDQKDFENIADKYGVEVDDE